MITNYFTLGERGGSMVERRTPEREVRNRPPPCCVLEQDTLLPKSTGNTQEAVAPSRHDRKIVDWDVKPQHKQTNKFYYIKKLFRGCFRPKKVNS